MAIDSFAALKTGIADWSHRGDLTSRIPDFITLAETKMTEDLDAKAMETTVTLVTVAGSAYVNLPTDFKTMKRLVLLSSPNVTLKYAAPEELSADFPYTDNDKSAIYTVIGSQIQLAPTPDAIYSLSIVYERKIPALSDINTTNWLLTRSPNAYLFGGLMMLYTFTRNDQQFAIAQSMYATAVNDINMTDWHVGATMRIRTDGAP